MRNRVSLIGIVLVLLLASAACGRAAEGPRETSLTLYSGRSEELVGPLVEQFEEKTGIDVEARYGDTAALASTLIEEGDRSPADVFWAQDAGALGAVAGENRFAPLPRALLDRVPARYRSADGLWVGTSGRARVLVYNKEKVSRDDLPASVLDLTDGRWRGRVGWAPTNGSFQAFVTALRVLRGDDKARAWLQGMERNETREYESNSPIVQAVASGEIDAGLVNHYYLLELSEEDPGIADRAANHFFRRGDPGNLINVAGVGILEQAPHEDAARRFVEFLLSRTGEQYFDEETIEYPLQEGAEPDPELPPLDEIGGPDIDLSDLSDLQGTLELLRETGVL
jgi:iron(III) transport system substrate-binding protein